MRNDTEALLQSHSADLSADASGCLQMARWTLLQQLFMHHKAAVQGFIDHRQFLLSHIVIVKSKRILADR